MPRQTVKISAEPKETFITLNKTGTDDTDNGVKTI